MQKSLEKRNCKTIRTVAMSCTIAAVMVLYLPVMALARTYSVNDGDILIEGTGTDTAPDHTVKVNNQVVNDHDPSPVVTGTSDQYLLTLDASAGDVNVTFDNLTINAENSNNDAAVTVTGANDVTIELENNNDLTGGRYSAALEDQLTGILTIQDADNDGSLTARGGYRGAGIGGGYYGAGSNITIKGGTIAATGGGYGAGIGGGQGGDGSNTTIEGGVVTAIGGNYGSGIGSGYSGAGSNITIKGGTVTATGGERAAGIGGGYGGTGSNITISGSANVSVAGGPPEYRQNNNGAAIGNGAGLISPGEEVAPDIRNLYPTGSITVYAAGTTVADMRNAQPESITIGTGPVRNPVPGRAITSDGNDASTAVVSDGDADAAFFAAVDMQIDDLLKEINTLIAEGRLDEAKALIEKGLTINAGTHQSFNAATLAKLGEASRMGIAVTVNFTYAGAGYSVTIPGNSQIDPSVLVDENGYCGFLNLLKYFK